MHMVHKGFVQTLMAVGHKYVTLWLFMSDLLFYKNADYTLIMHVILQYKYRHIESSDTLRELGCHKVIWYNNMKYV